MRWPRRRSSTVAVTSAIGHPLNLAAAAAIQAGLSIDADEISMPVLIVSGAAAAMSPASEPPSPLLDEPG